MPTPLQVRDPACRVGARRERRSQTPDCRPARHRPRLPVRPRRRADRDRRRPRRRVEARRSTSSCSSAPEHGEPFRFDAGATTTQYVDGKPRADGVRDFLASRGITLPEGAPDDPPAPRPSTASAPARTSWCCGASTSDGVEVYPGLGALPRGRARRRACDRGGRPSANSERGPRRGRVRRPVRRAGRRGRRRARGAARASPRPTPSWPARALARASSRRRRRSSRTRCPASRPAGPGSSATSSASTASARPTSWRARCRRRRDGPGRAAGGAHDDRRAPSDRAVVAARDPPRPRRRSAHESLFALSNGHIGMRGYFDEGEPLGSPAPTSTASTRSGRCPTPRPATATPSTGQTMVNVTDGKLIRLLVDDSPLDLRYGKLHSPRAHARPAGRRPATRRRVALARRAGGAGPQHAAGLARPSARSPRSSTRSSRSTTRRRVVRAVGAGGQRDAAATEPTTRAPPPRWSAAGQRAASAAGDAAPCWCTAPGAATCGWPPHGPRLDIPDRAPRTPRRRRPGPVHARHRLQPGQSLRWSSSSPTAGRRALAARLRDQVDGALAAPARRLGRAGPRAARALDQLWDEADVEVEGDAELQQAVRFALFHVLQAGARGERQPDPGQGADRARLRRPHLLGHRDASCCRC